MSDRQHGRTPRCDGYEYENMTEYDLRDDFDRFAFPKKLDRLMDWFEEADVVHANEDGGHRHFEWGSMEIWCNLEKVSDRIRRIYYTLEVPEDD